MNVKHYIGFDVHKKSVSYCVKLADGKIVEKGKLKATRSTLLQWVSQGPEPWHGAMEATLFSGWIYDTLKPYAAQLEMGHPAMMKAIGASKKKNDKLDARRISDLVRCNLLPACWVAPGEIRELRRMLRYRNLVLDQAVQMKNKISLLMESGAEYNKKRLHGEKYFSELLESLGAGSPKHPPPRPTPERRRRPSSEPSYASWPLLVGRVYHLHGTMGQSPDCATKR